MRTVVVRLFARERGLFVGALIVGTAAAWRGEFIRKQIRRNRHQ